MENNIYDKIIEELQARRKLVNMKISKQFSNQMPFRMKPLTDKEIVGMYDKMNEQDWYDALDKFGVEQVDAFREKAERIKEKRLI